MKVTRLIHTEDQATHHRKAIGFSASDSRALTERINNYFSEHPQLRIVCMDPEVAS